MPEPSSPRRWYLVAGVTVIAIALWLLLEAAGVPVPSARLYWPLFILPGAVASIADFFIGSRRGSSMGRGVAALGFAGLFFAFTFGHLRFANFFDWWPAIPLIAGVGFLTTFFADRMKTASYLVTGVIFLGIGLSFWATRFAWLQRLVPSPAVAWGILLLGLGIFLVGKTLRGRKG
ncbi:MAG: hypothetical protein KDD47_20260 [Acidobacteria bacterium]|nr:hypothetical protein [Acidobacteriota bacterium]